MSTRRQTASDFQIPIKEMVATALSQDRLAGITEVLRSIANSMAACGCILWEVIPRHNSTHNLESDTLFILASWFQDESKLFIHKMRLKESANGQALLQNRYIIVDHIAEDPIIDKNIPQEILENFKTLCAMPISLHDSGVANGYEQPNATICVYRDTPRPFTEEEALCLEQLADLFPQLYQSIRNRESNKLISALNRVFDEFEPYKRKEREKNVTVHIAQEIEGEKNKIKVVLNNACKEISNTFHCIETSIFLEDRFEKENRFNSFATTWRDWGEFKKEFYLPLKTEGLTGWALKEKKHIRVFDMGALTDNIDQIRKEYDDPELCWNDPLDIKKSVRKILDWPPGNELPPISFMCVPIIKGQKLLGVIRCCAAKKAPWYFDDRKLKLLKLIADQISRFLNESLQHIEEEEENDSWLNLVEEINQLNNTVQSQLHNLPMIERKEQEIKWFEERRGKWFEEALRICEKVIRGADILDVRILVNQEKRYLRFEKTLGEAWDEGTDEEINARKAKRFYLDEPSKNSMLGKQVFSSGKAEWIIDVDKTDPKYKSETFPKTERVIVAPIGVQGEVVGLLDVRGTSRPFPKNARSLAALIGQQLGLYLLLSRNIEKSEKRKREQKQMFEDFVHQVRDPIYQMASWAQIFLERSNREELQSDQIDGIDNIFDGDEVTTDILTLRGAARKAKRVAVNAYLFQVLAREDRIELNKNRVRKLEPIELRKRLVEAAIDNQLRYEVDGGVKFKVNRSSDFHSLRINKVMVDYDLFEQALNCILDNAGKYSFPRYEVKISVYSKGRDFYVEVENTGLPIRPDDVKRCKEPYWRGKNTKHIAGEGSGLGLYLTDQIMLAHQGDLVISPTTVENKTQVKLVFPIAK